MAGFDSWISLIASLPIVMLCGSIYSFSIYSATVRDTLGLDVVQTSTLGGAIGIGCGLALPAGYAFDRWGRVPCLIVGCAVMTLGYLILYLACYGEDSLRFLRSFPVIYTALFLVGQAMNWLDVAAIGCNMTNFSRCEAGRAVGLVKAVFGLSTSILTLVYGVVFQGETGGFLKFMCGFSLVCLPFGLKFLKQECLNTSVEGGKHFQLGYGIAGILMVWLCVSNIMLIDRQVSLVGALLLCSMFLLLPFLLHPSKKIEEKAEPLLHKLNRQSCPSRFQDRALYYKNYTAKGERDKGMPFLPLPPCPEAAPLREGMFDSPNPFMESGPEGNFRKLQTGGGFDLFHAPGGADKNKILCPDPISPCSSDRRSLGATKAKEESSRSGVGERSPSRKSVESGDDLVRGSPQSSGNRLSASSGGKEQLPPRLTSDLFCAFPHAASFSESEAGGRKGLLCWDCGKEANGGEEEDIENFGGGSVALPLPECEDSQEKADRLGDMKPWQTVSHGYRDVWHYYLWEDFPLLSPRAREKAQKIDSGMRVQFALFLLFCMTAGMGTGLSLISNAGLIFEQIQGTAEGALALVSLLSISNCCGRLFFGVVSDMKHFISRPSVLVLCLSSMSVGTFLVALCPQCFQLGCCLTAFCYGGCYSLLAPLCGELLVSPSFGLGVCYSGIQLALPLGTALFSWVLPSVFCGDFKKVFFVAGLLSGGAAIGPALLLSWKTKEVYKDLKTI